MDPEEWNQENQPYSSTFESIEINSSWKILRALMLGKIMRIALVAPPWIRIPPRDYGGIEYIVGLLADGLVERGHQVTLFSVKSSRSRAEIDGIFQDERIQSLTSEPSALLTDAVIHAAYAYRKISRGNFDLVNDHTWKEGLCFAPGLNIPVIHTIHGTTPIDHLFYSQFNGIDRIGFVSISEAQRKIFPGLNFLGTVHHGIDLKEFPFCNSKQDYLLYLGRFTPEKGPHLAAEAAKILGYKLILAGKLNEPSELRYFRDKVQPMIDGENIMYEGKVSDERKKQLLMNAKGLLMPIQWEEPFGIVMIEAMACGTPVISFNRGSAPEIILDGITGFLASDFQDFLDKIAELDRIDPVECRRHVERNFSAEIMVKRYEEIYIRFLESLET